MCACVVKPLLEPLPHTRPMQNENTLLHVQSYPPAGAVGNPCLPSHPSLTPLPPNFPLTPSSLTPPPSHSLQPHPPPPHTPCKRAPPHAVVEVGRADPGQVMAALFQSATEHRLEVSERPALWGRGVMVVVGGGWLGG